VRLRQLREQAGVELRAADGRHPARRHRAHSGRASAALDQRALTEHRARTELTDPGAPHLNGHDAVEDEEDIGALIPSVTRASPFATVPTRGLVPPRMMLADSCRSRALSTSLTSAGESSSPHGLCDPKARRDQPLKFTSPDF
jgi:hypothetical protein